MFNAESHSARLLQLASGFRTTQALYVVAKLGVADLLVSGPRSCEELARDVGAHSESLFRVMRALASLGVFYQDSSDRFALNPMSYLLLKDAPGSVRAAVVFWGGEMYRAAGELMHSVKTGETAFNHIYGEGHFEYLSKNPEANEIFNTMMAQMIGANPSRRSIEKYDFQGRKVVVDVGGGSGTLLASVLERNPQLKGILYDLPSALETAPSLLKSRQVDSRVKVISGSAFDSLPGGGDVYIFSRVLHDHPDEVSTQILKHCRKVIPRDGLVLIGDAVIPKGDTPSQGKLVDLTMLLMTGGKERTEEEWKKLLKAGGFSLQSADVEQSLVVATPD